MTALTDIPREAEIRRLIARHADMPGGLMPLLHALQDSCGFVPPEAVPLIAKGMNLSRAEVHGVITYYHHFRSTPPGRHVVQVCRAEACRACGAEALMQHAQQVLGCAEHETRGDGMVTLTSVCCLGLCASAPSVQIDARVHARMTPAKLDKLLSPLEVLN